MLCPSKLVCKALRNKFQPWRQHKDLIGPELKNPTGKQIKHTNSQHLVEEAIKGKPELSFEEIVLKEYWNYKEVFTGRPKGQLLPKRPWNHYIKIKEDTEHLLHSKLYSLSPAE